MREAVREDAARVRMDEIEGVLRELGDIDGLFQLGLTHYHRKDFERSSRVLGLAAHLERVSGTPESLERAARVLYSLGVSLESWERTPQEVDTAYRETAAAGRRGRHPGGVGNNGVGAVQPRGLPRELGAYAAGDRDGLPRGGDSGTRGRHPGGVGNNGVGAVQPRGLPRELGAYAAGDRDVSIIRNFQPEY